MNKTILIAVAAGALAGYFFANSVATVPGVAKAYEFGANLA